MIKKISFSFVFFLISMNCLGGASDSINLSSEILPVCEVSFNAEPIASNLDITTTQTNLHIGDIDTNSNTPGSNFLTTWDSEFVDHLTHQVMGSEIFTFSNLQAVVTDPGSPPFTIDPFPMGSLHIPDAGGGESHIELNLSYTGVPSLSLVQGTYSATWYVSCSVEPKP